MHVRIIKILLVGLASMYATLATFNNITDYGSNFQFVQHVLSMDTTFPGNNSMWRAIESPIVHHIAYLLIIATEATIAILGWFAVAAMWRAKSNPGRFDASKRLAVYTLTLGIALWFGGFIIIGGEWFLMWQSEIWNGIAASFRVSALYALILLVIVHRES